MTKEVDGREQTFENFDNIDYGVRTIQSATAVSANTGYLRLSEESGKPQRRRWPNDWASNRR